MVTNRFAVTFISLGILGVSGLYAQSSQPHAWRTAADSAPVYDNSQPYDNGRPYDVAQNNAPPPAPYNDPPPAPGQDRNYPPPNYPQSSNYPQGSNAPQSYNPPSRLVIHEGTWITVHADDVISSDRNHAGDTFFATLAEPVIVDGVVVAHRGQRVMGRVSAADNPPRGNGRSQLGLQVTSLTLADGSQVQLESQVVDRRGESTTGRDLGTVATTTALGAAIGAAAGYGPGAAIGATAGAAAGLIGLMVSHGQPTVVYPESLLTFQIQAPVIVATERAPGAFRYADSQDYGVSNAPPAPAQRRPVPPARVYGRPYPYSYGYPSPYYGSGLSIYVGPRFGYYGPVYRGRGYRW